MTQDERRALIYKDGLTSRDAALPNDRTQTDVCPQCCGFKGADVNGNYCGECGGFGSIIRLQPRFRV